VSAAAAPNATSARVTRIRLALMVPLLLVELPRRPGPHPVDNVFNWETLLLEMIRVKHLRSFSN
jgi:hypothetical protein